MKHTILAALSATILCTNLLAQPARDSRTKEQILFEDGNYAMFIHFGLYSYLEGEWQGKTYRGNAEWIMHTAQAGIPRDEYMALASDFNPSEFNAEEVVRLAKDAGMKYIVITSKHHEGFAMFDSDYCDFNIKDATPCKRDLIGELAQACHKEGIGIGFYYSQFQDWTAPGGGNNFCKDEKDRRVSFDEYFRNKCVPQIEEITTKYGEIQLIWFDTPGNMNAHYSKELVDIVHKNQPGCLVSSRVGNGMGDYNTLGDMEIPVENISGRWEGIDVMQVGWGFEREDKEWKSPEYVVRNLMGVIARGGTFMMNVGPDARGRIPAPAAASLRSAGKWVAKYEDAVRAVEASPWGHALQWGDAVVKGEKLYLIVYDWPTNGTLIVPGLRNEIKSAKMYGGKKLKVKKCTEGYALSVPALAQDPIASVIELNLSGKPDVDRTFVALDGYQTVISPIFSKLDRCKLKKDSWNARLGEWKKKWVVNGMSPESSIEWTFEVPHEGYYNFDVELKNDSRLLFTLTSDEGEVLTNEQPSYPIFSWQRAGWLHFSKPGTHKVTLRVTENTEALVSNIRITPVRGI